MNVSIGVLFCALLAWLLWTPDRNRAQLESKYLASAEDMKQIGVWRLHVRDSGPRDAPAVIMIHGFGSSLQTWDAWAAGLSRTMRVIRFDLPGNGLSPPDPAGDYTDARSLQLLLTLMDTLKLQRASIIGHSIGGRIAFTFAAKYPDRIDRLVLVAPDGFSSPGFEYGKAPSVPAVLGLMRYVMPRPLLRMNLAPAYANASFLTDALVDRYNDLLLAPGSRQALLDRMRETVLVDPRPLLADIRTPTLLVWGESDAMIPTANSADYLKFIKGARLVVIPGSGHLPQEEAAMQSLSAVEAFLSP